MPTGCQVVFSTISYLEVFSKIINSGKFSHGTDMSYKYFLWLKFKFCFVGTVYRDLFLKIYIDIHFFDANVKQLL